LFDFNLFTQSEKEKKGPVFSTLTIETPQPIYKKVAKCIWLDSKKNTSALVDMQASDIDWWGSTDADVIVNNDNDISCDSEPDGLYESVLLYFKSYR